MKREGYAREIEQLLAESGIPPGAPYEVWMTHEAGCVAWSGKNDCNCHPSMKIRIPSIAATIFVTDRQEAQPWRN